MGEAGPRKRWDVRGAPDASEATRDGDSDLRYRSWAWAGGGGLELGRVMRRNVIRASRVVSEGRGDRRRKMGVASWSAHFALPTVPTLRADQCIRVETRFLAL